MSLLPQRKPTPRLEIFNYQGQYAYSVTVCTHNKIPFFKDKDLFDYALNVLYQVADKEQFNVLAYCFMPNHLHLLVAGSETSELIKLMKHFKQTTSYWFRKTYGKTLWQRGYYDHVLRKEEDLHVVARYIWGNPVRKGLVQSIEDYLYSGPSDNMGCGPT